MHKIQIITQVTQIHVYSVKIAINYCLTWKVFASLGYFQ